MDSPAETVENVDVLEASSSEIDEEGKGDAIVTMVDVLEQESAQEAETNAVLGGADDKNCTYSQGYMPRQPLYACKTCCKGSLAGVCLACSYNCHEGHDLVELYTKRNFRCDCGNSLFSGVKCSLDNVKDYTNEKNVYNQNFSGVYCTCHRPYPDPDEEEDDVMAQCVVCEDWYHGRHLKIRDDKLEEGELICHLCMEKLPFLRKYVGMDLTTTNTAECKMAALSTPTENKMADLTTSTENKMADLPTSAESKMADLSTPTENKIDDLSTHPEDKMATISTPVENKVEDLSDEATLSKGSRKRTADEASLSEPETAGATFWPAGWRDGLCRCQSCLDLFAKHQVSFLLDEGDSVATYEAANEARGSETQYERGMRALSSLDHVQQIEAIQSYNEMKSALMDHLQKFKDSKKVVSESDIRDFFDKMKAKRRRLLVPPTCR